MGRHVELLRTDASDARWYEIVRRLPRPTDAQRDAYARAMAQRHSWHKHLPVSPLVPFRFLVHTHGPESSEPNGRLLDRRYAITTNAHDHLQRYGYWTCVAPFGGGSGLIASRRDEAAVDDAFWEVDHERGGERIPIPREVLRQSLAWVNAFIDPRAARVGVRIWGNDADPAWSAAKDPYGLAAWRADHPGVALDEAFITSERARMLGVMASTMDRVAALIWG